MQLLSCGTEGSNDRASLSALDWVWGLSDGLTERGVEGKIYCDILQLLSCGTEGSNDTWGVYRRWIGRGG